MITVTASPYHIALRRLEVLFSNPPAWPVLKNFLFETIVLKEDLLVPNKKSLSLRPLSDRVAVRRLEPETISAGGIVIPDSASEKPNQGEVLAVGPGLRLENGKVEPVAVTVGDIVLFGKYSSNEIKIDGEEVLILKESDLLAIMTGSTTVSNSLEKKA
ncbi:MAG: chaperonin GroES [Glaciecola sp.]